MVNIEDQVKDCIEREMAKDTSKKFDESIKDLKNFNKLIADLDKFDEALKLIKQYPIKPLEIAPFSSPYDQTLLKTYPPTDEFFFQRLRVPRYI